MVDSPDKETTRTISRTFTDTMRHGWIGRRLPRLFREHGLVDVSVDTPIIYIGYTHAELLLGGHCARLQADGIVTPEAMQRWRGRLREPQERGLFLMGVTAFVVVGAKPGGVCSPRQRASSEGRAVSMRSAAVNGVTLEYEERGAGEPVAFIHLGMLADSFAPLMDQPALGGYRLIRYHRRGHGGSTRTDGPVTIADQAAGLAGLLAHLGIRRAHVAGHSFGGLVALQLAADRTDLVGSLVLMEAALRVRSGSPASQDLTRRWAPGFQRYREGDREGAMDVLLVEVFGPGYRQVLGRVLPGAWALGVRDADMFFGVETPELPRWQFGPAEAERIAAPVLSVIGSKSDSAFFEMERMLQGRFPHLETARVPGVNHLLHLQEPRAVAETLAAFFARQSLP